METPIPFLARRSVKEETLATARQDFDEFIQGWQTPELRQAHDVQSWVRHPRNIDILDNLIDLTKVWREEDSILDVGCYAGYLWDYLKPKRYVGIDILPEAIAAAQTLHPGVAFKVGDLFNLEDRADVVFCARVLIHLPRFEEAVRILCQAASKWVVLVLAVAEKDRCDRIRGQKDTYYFRWFSKDTIRKRGLLRVEWKGLFGALFLIGKPDQLLQRVANLGISGPYPHRGLFVFNTNDYCVEVGG